MAEVPQAAWAGAELPGGRGWGVWGGRKLKNIRAEGLVCQAKEWRCLLSTGKPWGTGGSQSRAVVAPGCFRRLCYSVQGGEGGRCQPLSEGPDQEE